MSMRPVLQGRLRVPGLTLKHAAPFVLGGLCLYLVWTRCAAVSLVDLRSAVAALPAQAWVLAMLATAGSFWAVGRYDMVLHRHLRTGQNPRDAARAGRAAIAIGQTIGFGLVTGALVRWKWFEPRMSLLRSGQLTLTVTVLFLASWAIVALAALSLAPVLPGRPGLWLSLAAIGWIGLVALSLWQPSLPRVPLRWPSVRALTRLLSLTVIDTGLAALALWLLLPAGAAVPFATLVPVYMLALGAALLSGTPGGVGPFEVTMLALLPGFAQVDLLAACIAFRVVYYALPALAAAAALGWRHFHPLPALCAPSDTVAQNAARHVPHAEVQLHHHEDKDLLWCTTGRTGWTAGPTAQSLVAFFDPLCAARRPDHALELLETEARSRDLSPFVYKCGGRMAAAARTRGYAVRAVAEDAVLCPTSFDLSARACRQLRRKLRKAESAEVTIGCARAVLPLDEMRALSDRWATRHDGERGFSMSRLADAPLKTQQVMLARQDGRLVAFASFHVTTTGWALDLMRAEDNAPDGTMHALVMTALGAAREAGCQRFSLAAVPLSEPPTTGHTAVDRVMAWMLTKADAAGLRQFKACFAPRWETRYIAAPTPLALGLGAQDVVRRIQPRAAAPGSARSDTCRPDLRQIEHDYEDYEIAS